MTDKTDSKERDLMALIDAYAEARHIGGCHTYNAKTAEARAKVVASLAASAGSEPVAPALPEIKDMQNAPQQLHGTDRAFWVLGWNECRDAVRDAEHAAAAQRAANDPVTHPSPPEGMVGGWIALPGTLPEPGTPVLLDIGKKYPIRAMWAAKHTVPAAGDDTDWGEYDEATDQYWCPEGWYEWNEHEDTNWAVSATPRAWAPLPPTSPADSRKGD